LRHRRWAGGRGVADRLPRTRLPAFHQRPGQAEHHAPRHLHLRAAHHPDPARLLDDVRAQPRYERAVQLPRLDRRVVALDLLPRPERRRHLRRADRVSGARDRGLGLLGGVPVHAARARLEHPAPVPGPPLHHLPPPLPGSSLMRAEARARLLATADRELSGLSPSYFALVMATGIVSIGAHLLHVPVVDVVLFAVNIGAYVVLWILTGLRL